MIFRSIRRRTRGSTFASRAPPRHNQSLPATAPEDQPRRRRPHGRERSKRLRGALHIYQLPPCMTSARFGRWRGVYWRRLTAARAFCQPEVAKAIGAFFSAFLECFVQHLSSSAAKRRMSAFGRANNDNLQSNSDGLCCCSPGAPQDARRSHSPFCNSQHGPQGPYPRYQPPTFPPNSN
jgi:hypothetical protein